MKNILVTSLGTSWSIVPELIGYTNPATYNLYKNHPNIAEINSQRIKTKIQPIDELWVVTTNGKKVTENIKILKKWLLKEKNLPTVIFYSYKELVELNSIDEIIPMRDLVYRTVLHAKEQTKGGKLYLSLAGGRKNMSADMQDAAYLFGCDALMHIMDNGNIDHKYLFNNKSEKEQIAGFIGIPGVEIQSFIPVIIQDDIKTSPITYVEPKLLATNFPLQANRNQKTKLELYNAIKKRRRESSNSLLSIYKKRSENPQTTYTAFQLLQPEIVEKLQQEKIGEILDNKEQDIAWLKKIPKAELHCHFGGILSPEEIIEVAKVNSEAVSEAINKHKEFKQWCVEIERAVEMNDTSLLPEYNPKENIKIGIRYFEYLMKTFNNNLIYSLAAYNAGPSKVKSWITTIFNNSNPLIAIENIPYKETRKYVKLIYRNIFFYNLLFEMNKSLQEAKR